MKASDYTSVLIPIVIVIVACLLWQWMLSMPDQYRIMVREDAQYEVETRFLLHWVNLGGPCKTIEDARQRITWFEEYDRQHAREKTMKRRVVESSGRGR